MHAIWLPQRTRIGKDTIFIVHLKAIVRSGPGAVHAQMPPAVLAGAVHRL